MVFGIFGLLSLLTILISIFKVIPKYHEKDVSQRYLSDVNLLTIGTFFAIVLLLIPVYYCWDGWKDSYAYLRPLFMTLVGAVQMFLMGLDFSLIEDALPTDPTWLKVLLSFYAAVLYVAAPLLTFGNILMLFHNLTGQLRLRLCKNKTVYLLSELNPQSVTLAESIPNERKDALFVFAGVSAQVREEQTALWKRVKMLDAITLKKDVTQIEFGTDGQPVEIFLISETEADNVACAISLTEKLKTWTRPICIYVFSSDPVSDEILDSLDMGDNVLSDSFKKLIEQSARNILFEDGWQQSIPTLYGSFMLRRIDPVDNLVKQLLTEKPGTDVCSVTILGMGRYGTHFLKTAVWYYQKLGRKLEFNIIDLGEENGDPKMRLEQSCPELITKMRATQPDEAYYDIEFFTGVDCFGSGLDHLILRQQKERFAKTDLVFIALGEDDRDIQAAIQMRRLFAQLQPTKGEPAIFAVVYDDQKADNLNVHKKEPNLEESAKQKEETPEAGLRNYKDQLYNIQFVGTHKAQYDYKMIERQRKNEVESLKYHLDWVRKESQLRHIYTQACDPAAQVDERNQKWYQAFRQTLEAEQNGAANWWGDEDYFKHGDVLDYHGPIDTEKVRKTMEEYMRHSYYRHSSMAKGLHKNSLTPEAEFPADHTDCPVCGCLLCSKARITEHMRWNAYMRSQGYCFGEKKNIMAKLHPDLLAWSKLSCREKLKD